MNTDANDPQDAAATPGAPDAQDGAAVPKKRSRAPRKTAVAPQAAGLEAVEPSMSTAEQVSAEPATARKPRRRAVKVEEAGDVAQEQVADAVVPAMDAPVVMAEASPAGAQERAAADMGIHVEDGEPRERGRNRRRGRRGGRTEGVAEGGDGIDGAAGALSNDGDSGDRAEAPGATGRALPPVVLADTGEVFTSVLSGEYDELAPAADDDIQADGPEKRVLAPDPDAPKLHKVLAQSGIGSRRDMEQIITEGRVSVNEEVAHIGMRVSFGDRVTIDGKPVRVRIAPPPPRVIAYHKVAGEVVTLDDPQQRPTVFRKLPRLQQGKWQSVGRLDINTEGLLLFTTSGDLANRLMHPRFGVEREYAVRVLGTLEKDAKAKLLAGVDIEGQSACFLSIEDGGGEGVNRWYKVVIAEGRNREVRKLFDAVGLTVSRLIRIRYGCVVLPRGLKRGVWVDLGEEEIKALRVMTGSGAPAPRQNARGEGRGDGGRPGQGGKPGRGQQPGRRQSEGQGAGGAGRDDGDRRGGRSDRPNDRPNDRNDRNARNDRSDRSARPDRGPRPDRTERAPRDRDSEDGFVREPGDPTRIPNPLVQTYDRRAAQSGKGGRVRDDDFENGPIPNPLQQTYDKRMGQESRGGFGGGKNNGGGKGRSSGGGERQPDPMKTAVGYIGADAFTRKMQGRGGGGGGRSGGNRGGRGGR
jgi:23S rRNA pseudouridine2605 synthase